VGGGRAEVARASGKAPAERRSLAQRRDREGASGNELRSDGSLARPSAFVPEDNNEERRDNVEPIAVNASRASGFRSTNSRGHAELACRIAPCKPRAKRERERERWMLIVRRSRATSATADSLGVRRRARFRGSRASACEFPEASMFISPTRSRGPLTPVRGYFRTDSVLEIATTNFIEFD